MPQPTRGDVHVSRALTNISVAYLQSAEDYVAMKVFPSVPVVNRSDSYFVFDSADFRRNNAKPRAPGTESAGGGFDITTATYTTEVYAWHQDIYDQIRANADPAIDLERGASEFTTQQLLIQKEVQWASDFFATSIWGTDKTGLDWSDSSSDPQKDIDDGRSVIRKATGLSTNTLVVGYDVHLALKRHPLIKEQYKHTTADSITEQMIARALELDRYIVGKASYTTSEELASSETNAYVLGKHALLCHSAPTPGLLTPSAGYTFVWSAFSGANGGIRMKRFRMEELEADRVEGEFAYDHKAVLTTAGYFFSSVVA